jgi:TetR/AcrR family transcriptional regulator, cholesterol catabolism regulator
MPVRKAGPSQGRSKLFDMPTKSQDIDRVDEVVEVALRLFLERGYDNTPMSLLAKKLGLTKAGIYHHFASKEDLLFVVHKTAMERGLKPVFAAAARESDPERRLRVFLHEHARMLALDPAAMLLIREARRLSPKHLQEIKKTWRRGFDIVRDAIAELQQQRRCRADAAPTFAAFAGIGMASWIAYWFDPARPQTAETVAKAMTDIFIAGLLAEPTPQSRDEKCNSELSDAALATPRPRQRPGARKAVDHQARRRA